MKYNVGDIVYIKSLQWFKKNNKSTSSLSRPLVYCGKIAKIEYKNNQFRCYLINIDNHMWNWDEEMFEDIKEVRKRKLKKLNRV